MEKDAEKTETANGASEFTGLLSAALRALCLTRDYVGEKTLPAIDGWEWFEAGKAISKEIPGNEWAMQFALRTGFCPQCQSDTGVKIPQGAPAYCEDCGWPDGDFDNEG